MLRVENLNVHYGGIHALRGITLDVEEGKIISLIGANGAGKSTTLRAIMGLEKPSKGKIIYNGKDITGKQTKEIVKSNLVLVPEGRRVFTNLSVIENLILGSYIRNDAKEIQKDLDWVFELFPILKSRQEQKAGTMSGGEQQMLAVGRALMTKPKLLMMDEPSLGLAPLIVKNIIEIIKKINQEGVTILLIEQNAKASLEISDYAYVLETGEVFMEGKGMDLLNNEEVKKAYLGT
ncbi:leucine/isoleucine/valine transporter subunit; ATP-binding component of ABC superfamily [Petrocella atlantisensis]|uniref:Leucine/isoleucine/valine transporter subunit ATP-binding component of ABC superfamily n=1 Tax=Petrocella atlantisensis TaxID=2173034 RepID=A0A3P7S204_9FIRM|nr:ABC transporter ATP-binding protein [Petrocella atlantisensis]MCF8020742.1 ABC transporter ATP-binding protein [Vallitaleaceae bacterium]PKM54279.1 MAG: ABC transporter ATP-binding protein [Firmicutes bacterium HGW-Firmicutes-5]VDN48702.1 leucine/isoleucine/valine transporter subunit; ATP-binding component of ABC superfamily [Petrocella atlantisensis]